MKMNKIILCKLFCKLLINSTAGHLNGVDVKFELDTGAEAIMLSMEMYEKIPSVYPMESTNTVLVAFGQNKTRRYHVRYAHKKIGSPAKTVVNMFL